MLLGLPLKTESFVNLIKLLPYTMIVIAIVFLMTRPAYATQLHNAAEGVIVHQIGHIFFLVSMVILYFTIRNKALDSQKGWRFIQFSALLFVLWNLDALIVHFLDNQILIITPIPLSVWEIKINAENNSISLIWLYYFLRLDHLLSLPAMIFLWKGLNLIIQHDMSIESYNDGTMSNHNATLTNSDISINKSDA